MEPSVIVLPNKACANAYYIPYYEEDTDNIYTEMYGFDTAVYWLAYHWRESENMAARIAYGEGMRTMVATAYNQGKMMCWTKYKVVGEGETRTLEMLDDSSRH